MFLIFLFATIAPHPGGVPTDWQPLSGVQQVNYRWSRPTSNSCLIEVVAEGKTSEPLQLRINAKVLSRRPDPPIAPTPGSPIYVEPTKIKPQTEEREFSIALSPHGRAIEDIHDCYGVQEADARVKSDHARSEDRLQTEQQTGGNQ